MVLEEIFFCFSRNFYRLYTKICCSWFSYFGNYKWCFRMFYCIKKAKFVWRCNCSCRFAWNWLCLPVCWSKRLIIVNVRCCNLCMVWRNITLAITNTTKIKQDAALGITLSVFFGLGIVLLTFCKVLEVLVKEG